MPTDGGVDALEVMIGCSTASKGGCAGSGVAAEPPVCARGVLRLLEGAEPLLLPLACGGLFCWLCALPAMRALLPSREASLWSVEWRALDGEWWHCRIASSPALISTWPWMPFRMHVHACMGCGHAAYRGDIESVSCCEALGPVGHGAISRDTKLKPSASSSLVGPGGEFGVDCGIVRGDCYASVFYVFLRLHIVSAFEAYSEYLWKLLHATIA